jgi:hypothetical protein
MRPVISEVTARRRPTATCPVEEYASRLKPAACHEGGRADDQPGHPFPAGAAIAALIAVAHPRAGSERWQNERTETLGHPMTALLVGIIVVVLALLWLATAVRIVTQYEEGVLFRLGRLKGTRPPDYG